MYISNFLCVGHEYPYGIKMSHHGSIVSMPQGPRMLTSHPSGVHPGVIIPRPPRGEGTQLKDSKGTVSPFLFFRCYLLPHTCIADKELITQSFLQVVGGAVETRTQNSPRIRLGVTSVA
jgi:hypothetical protein